MKHRTKTVIYTLMFALVGYNSAVIAVEMTTGMRVGEVTQDSATVWTRLTRDAQRYEDGFREPQEKQAKRDDYEPSPIMPEDREAATPGAAGQVRVVYSLQADLSKVGAPRVFLWSGKRQSCRRESFTTRLSTIPPRQRWLSIRDGRE